MKEKARFAAAAALLICLIILCRWAGQALHEEIQKGKEVTGKISETVVMLDPGHGGIDAGKTGVNGAEEKDINLQISLYIKNNCCIHHGCHLFCVRCSLYDLVL